MAEQELALYSPGYEDERFEHNVSQTFHCIICTNVIKDAVSCTQNEHLFCRSCITQHLMNSQTCPSCMEPLTVDTLSQAPRSVKSLLSELKIRCEFFERGCGKFVELGDLERHVKECGFAPAFCSNDDCQLEVNRRDLLHHETAECEWRRVKCHNCENMKKEMDAVKLNLAAMNEKLEKNETSLERIEANIAELVQEQLTNQEESIVRLEAGNVEMKESLIEIKKLLEKITQVTQPPSHQTLQEVEAKTKLSTKADFADANSSICQFDLTAEICEKSIDGEESTTASKHDSPASVQVCEQQDDSSDDLHLRESIGISQNSSTKDTTSCDLKNESTSDLNASQSHETYSWWETPVENTQRSWSDYSNQRTQNTTWKSATSAYEVRTSKKNNKKYSKK